MARARDPNRDKAFEIYKEHNGEITNRKIAEMLGVPEKTISGWKSKSKDNWKEKLNGVLQSDERSTPIKKENKPQVKKQKERPIETLSEDEESQLDEYGLTAKQRRFVEEYLKTFNATSAYKKAYKCQYNTAMSNGYRMLRNAEISEAIKKIKDERLFMAEIEGTDILMKYKKIAFADITDFIDFSQVETTMEITTTEYDADGNATEKVEATPYTYTKFAMHHSDEIDGTLITELSKGKDGMFKVKLADKMAALAFLAKYTDLLSEQEVRKLKVEKERITINKLNGDTSDTQESEIAKMLRKMAGEE